METAEILKSIKQVIIDISSSTMGICDSIDDLYINNAENVRADCTRMQIDRAYYEEVGGCEKWCEKQNENILNKYDELLKANGYEIQNIDYFDEHNGTLFVRVIKIDRAC